MRKWLQKKAGASTLGYGLVVGLISVVSLGAVTGAGSSVANLFGQTSNALGGVEGVSSAQSQPQAALSLVASSGDPSNYTVTGPGNDVPGSVVSFTLTNTGNATSDSLSVSLASGANFALSVDDCTGNALAAGAACTIQVDSLASASGPFSDTLQISGSGGASVSLSGTASNFTPAALAFDSSPVGTGMDVSSGSNPGACRTFTLRNTGEVQATSLSVSLASGADFETDGCTATTCGSTLDGGSSCDVSVRANASGNGSISDTLQASASGPISASVSLSGTASGLGPAVLAWDSSPSGSGMNVASGSNPGSCVTFTLRNTGETAATSLSISLTNTGNFEFSGCTATTCGSTLGNGDSCEASVRPKASGDGSYNGNLRASASGVSNGDKALSGSGSGLGFATGTSLRTGLWDYGNCAGNDRHMCQGGASNVPDSACASGLSYCTESHVGGGCIIAYYYWYCQ